MSYEEAYWYGFIEMCTTYKRTILEVFRKDIFSKFVFPITFPGDAFLVHCQIIIVASEGICVIEQTPSHKTTRYNCIAIEKIFRLTTISWILIFWVSQLLIISAFNIPELQKIGSRTIAIIKNWTGCIILNC